MLQEWIGLLRFGVVDLYFGRLIGVYSTYRKQRIMILKNTYIAARVIESLENYSVCDDFSNAETSQLEAPSNELDLNRPQDDMSFWDEILNGPDESWNKVFTLHNVGLSEWVSRVPGLFYGKNSITLRELAESKIELVSNGRWKHYSPGGKSEMIMGGIGTVNLPNEHGFYLSSVSFSNNASTGIPVLIKEEAWEHYRLKEGALFSSLKGKWKKMPSQWSSRFPSVANIPKGYIEVLNMDDVKMDNHIDTAPTVFHPFSIMEYEKNGGLLYDYVYVTVDSMEKDYRKEVRSFFGEYEYFENRNGRYLIEPFINNPLLHNVHYSSPAELRSSSPEASSHLELLTQRIRNETFKGETLESIKISIDNKCSLDQLKRLSDSIKINPNRWFSGRAIVHESASFLEYCLSRNKIEELVDVLSIENPNMFSIY